MTRWLWVWFILLLGFPVLRPSGLLVRPALHPPLGTRSRNWSAANASATRPATVPGSSPRVTSGANFGGALAPVLDRLEWVGGRRVSAAELGGKVVLVEFWTFDCVNCRRTAPAMMALDLRYRGTDVRLLGIHTPELAHERDPVRVARAVTEAGIEYPVALDPGFTAWEAMGNRYWPCLWLLDGSGVVRYRHVGELHQGSPGWNELIGRIEALRARHS